MSSQSMDVFSLRDAVVGEYEQFATSFTTIHADDIATQIRAIYESKRYWPESLIQINPNYLKGRRVARAIHIEPWADCETDAERLDVYNGLLLAPHLDAAFDRGFITVADDGAIVVSNALDADSRATLGLAQRLRAHGLVDGHRAYLPWHRKRVFNQEGA